MVFAMIRLLRRSRCARTALVVVAVGAILACRRPASPVARCTTQDLLSSVGSAAYPKIDEQAPWMRQARLCDVGAYVIAMSQDPDASSVYVLRKGEVMRPLFLKNAGNHSTVLFDAPGEGRAVVAVNEEVSLLWREPRRVVASDRHPASGPDVFSYAAYDSSRRAWIEHVDVGRDGTFDIRQTEVEGQPIRREMNVADRWLETVERDGKTGVVFNGRFMSLQDARATAASRVVP